MKRIKFLTALVVAISMLFVVAAAADIEVNDVEYNGTDSTITVTVKAATAMTLDQFDCFYMTYDADVFSVGTMASSDAKASVTDDGGVITWSNTAAATEVAVGDEILTVNFNVIAADKAVDKEFTVYEEFTMWNSNGENADYNATITVVAAAAPPFVAETKEGTEVAATATDIELEKDPATSYKNQYVGTAVFNATLGADVKYGEAGFIWVKDGVKTANKFAVDASAINGGGTFDYGVAMYAIPDGVTITAIPYYVTAE